MIVEAYRATVCGQNQGKRMVRKSIDGYVWIEQSTVATEFNVAQGTCSAEDLPGDVLAKLEELGTGLFKYVSWPKEA